MAAGSDCGFLGCGVFDIYRGFKSRGSSGMDSPGFKTIRREYESTQLAIELLLDVVFPAIRRLGREAKQSPPM